MTDLAAGCCLLGSGGGGGTHAYSVFLHLLVDRCQRIAVVDPDDLSPDALVVNVGFVGAPVATQEKLVSEGEITTAVKAMQRRLGRPIEAFMAAEIGGGNGLTPFIAAALFDLPVVDADGMGRAFPLSDQVTYAIYGHSALPTVVSNEHGDVAIIEAATNRRTERLARALSVAMGSKCFSVDYPLSGTDVRACAVLRTVSLARDIGAAIRGALRRHGDPLRALKRLLQSERNTAVRLLFEGTVVNYEHETRAGFGFGRVHLARSGDNRREMTVDFQNEFLIARQDGASVASTPDIIAIVDTENPAEHRTDSIRYGQRVKVLAIEGPAPNVLGKSARSSWSARLRFRCRLPIDSH